jgi:hypothetical protein
MPAGKRKAFIPFSPSHIINSLSEKLRDYSRATNSFIPSAANHEIQ